LLGLKPYGPKHELRGFKRDCFCEQHQKVVEGSICDGQDEDEGAEPTPCFTPQVIGAARDA
jgi:hypothetical protein